MILGVNHSCDLYDSSIKPTRVSSLSIGSCIETAILRFAKDLHAMDNLSASTASGFTEARVDKDTGLSSAKNLASLIKMLTITVENSSPLPRYGPSRLKPIPIESQSQSQLNLDADDK